MSDESLTGGRAIARALVQAGIEHVFGIPGTHNIELYDAMLSEPTLKPVLITDEQSAGFMADGIARATGKLAALNVVPGAGVTHALSGIAEAWMDQVPMLVLACGIRTDTGRAYQLHDIDQAGILRTICKKVYQPRTVEELVRAILEGAHLARQSPPAPVAVEMAANLLLVPEAVSSMVWSAGEAVLGSSGKPRLDPTKVSAAADLICASRNVGLYLGLGARGAGRSLVELAEVLDARVFTTISGKGVFPENHPRWVWSNMGRTLPGELKAHDEKLDCLLAIGCRFGEVATGSYGFAPPEQLIHVDIDSSVFQKNYPARLAVCADAGEFVSALSRELVSRKRTRAPSETTALVTASKRAWSDRADEQSKSSSQNGVSPRGLFVALQRVLPKDAVYSVDSGNGLFLAMEQLRLDEPGCFLAPVDFSCMGYSVPAAIGAKLAAPSRAVVALPGDGAFLMTGMELLTAAQQRVGVMVFVLRDRELSQIAQFQQASLQRKTNTELPPIDLEAFARAIGLGYRGMANEGELASGIQWALDQSSAGKPCLVEVAIDYSEPTDFSKGVIKTNFLRFGWKDRARLVARVLRRKLGMFP